MVLSLLVRTWKKLLLLTPVHSASIQFTHLFKKWLTASWELVLVKELTSKDLNLKSGPTVSLVPQEALIEAASIMRKHINPFLSYNNAGRVGPAEAVGEIGTAEDNERDEKLRLPISVLEPSARTRNCLEAEGIETLGQLVALTEHELMKFRNFGQTSLNEIREKLVAFNLEIGQTEK